MMVAKDESHPPIDRRPCFAHNIRIGGTRGGGIRGGKGSLPRYLLQQGVPPKIMTKMMSLIIMFNYIPNGEVFENAMILFLNEFDEYANKHVREYYLDPKDPKKLGGRAVGEQGQPGSNQGVEKRGGIIKTKFKGQVKGQPAAERKNFLRIMEAIAIDCWSSIEGEGGLEKLYARKPHLTVDDYELIRNLSKWEGGQRYVSCDVVYMICHDDNQSRGFFPN